MLVRRTTYTIHMRPCRGEQKKTSALLSSPQTNGCVERVQRTVLEECWRPTFACSLVPKYTALRRDLARATSPTSNFDRAHLGRYTKGRTPGEVVYGSRKMHPS